MAQTPEINERDWAAWRSLDAMHRQLGHALEGLLQNDAGLSGADFQVLSTLCEADNTMLRSGDLAELIGWEKSRLSHQVSRMQARGLVERRECESDLRGTWIAITDAGHELARAAMPERIAAMRAMFFDVLSEEEKDAVTTIGRKVLDAIDPPACGIAAGMPRPVSPSAL
jgi:DNA-binding MarR family transcriptional regulator